MLCILLAGLFPGSKAFTQADTLFQNLDTAKTEVSKTRAVKEIAEGILQDNRDEFSEKQSLALQKQKMDQLRIEVKKTEDFFKRGLDTNRIKRELKRLQNRYQVSTKGIRSREATFQSAGNLTSTALLLTELDNRLEIVNESIYSYRSEVDYKRKLIDSLSTDSALFYLPRDTSKLNDFIVGFTDITNDIAPVDKMLNDASTSITHLEKLSEKLKGNISFYIYTIDSYRKNVAKSMFSREMPGMFEGDKTNKPLKDILYTSLFKTYTIILFFTANNLGSFVMMALLCLLIYLMFSSVSKKVKVNEELLAVHIENEIVDHPFLSALFIVLNAGQFFFVNPPFAMEAVFWIMLSIILMILHRKSPEIFTGHSSLYLLILFVLAIIDNLILEPSKIERWALIILTIASCIFSIQFIRKNRKNISVTRFINFLLYLFIVLQIIALVAILAGRFNLCKTLFTGGYVALIAGLFVYWTFQLLVKALDTYSVTASNSGNDMFLKLKAIHHQTPGWIKASFFVIWFIIFLRNFYFYSVIVSTIDSLMTTERTIGKFTYTLESIFVFILVLFLSSLASKFVSFLAGDSAQTADGKKKGGLSNWLLLIKLTIIIVGVLLAFASAGIPMDRVTLIIGSLSLGIGFGLQTIVNNLISGVILAVERPIEIGDQVEVAGRTGHIKEIGIRSSKLLNFDGAEVIIPNGDLLSQHVINWTLTNRQRRIDLIIGVKYGSDLQKAKQILQTVLLNNKKIERNPSPSVLLHQFNSSSIDLRLLFWSDIGIWLDVKSEIILSIDKAFKDAGIEIPFPQQDLYIKELPVKPKTEEDIPDTDEEISNK